MWIELQPLEGLWRPVSLNPYSNGMWIEHADGSKTAFDKSLNPYSNGMWIERPCECFRKYVICLNPYSNGMWIEQPAQLQVSSQQVLILILMECG